ncbi:hypothetical protein [Paenibacillus pabuli]|uniref:hypothetical protein n=1 Tax=Paenibacillus pabuli TaxID=1472 RepID=UPI003241C9B3
MMFINDQDRHESFTQTLNDASGLIFISGISMGNIFKYSLDLIEDKLKAGAQIRFLMADYRWVANNIEMFRWLNTDAERKAFIDECYDSTALLLRLANTYDKVSYAVYTEPIPYIMTGYINNSQQFREVQVEVVDYFPGNQQLRMLINDSNDPYYFDLIYSKFVTYFNHYYVDER